ncbi:MAG: flagellar basal-body rod protein FlgG [Aminobacterium sp.]|jgi:flagellar basal-body rod protein FlgG|uniref:flagellar basal-body rod protein FlgG n=1 Tax=unclassified Aminobacterium TaxID=2685012 RepID=UPI001BCFD34B|nr:MULTISPECIES: flagellar basal-body rod protein FlgG [unclassified Aminobacterium]MDD2207378.1 flagellar basal-body rod protein FlgG [Aminobacterium sp.]MDD3426008.1 flagellar basal-body rod protein FlgG [Aminobacterium sp.]MDD3707841.1 flagellar basal-body rod protein FlgG [Aminobacterium sp.]MDD4229443.1 flagellar basal-body rod protein FlgG [Aminobacterium sp.]MDD4552103.1 flagellar basal-body rod protein FlgG [Aminobacterium sp.]
MIRSLWSAATGMVAQQTNLDVTSNNLANVNTSGYKKMRADFQDLLYQIDREPGAPVETGTTVPTGIQVGLGTKVVGTSRTFSEGNLQVTNNPLDITIEGDGFFQVIRPNGEIAYTRDGSWKVDGEGQIVTADGFLLEPAITIPDDATEIIIDNMGRVSVKTVGNQEADEIGQIEIARFVNPAGLRAMGRNLFEETPASGEAIEGIPGEDGLGTLHQGILEMSNVQVVEEMVNLIVAQRAYEANSKSIQTADELLRIANSLRR